LTSINNKVKTPPNNLASQVKLAAPMKLAAFEGRHKHQHLRNTQGDIQHG